MEKAEFFALCAESFEQNGVAEYAKDDVLSKLWELENYFLAANERINLTAIRDERLFISRHFADCLIPARLFDLGTNVLDVGSGGGMPTLPLAVVRPDLMITSLDATAKKTAFVEAAAKHLGLDNVSVATGRAEELARGEMRASFDIVTARAVADARVLIEWCVPFAKVGGAFIALKGKNADTELEAASSAARALCCRVENIDRGRLYDLDGGASARAAIVFKKYAPTPEIYPRKNSQIVKNPL